LTGRPAASLNGVLTVTSLVSIRVMVLPLTVSPHASGAELEPRADAWG
jgi:hypothetical protein